MVTAEPEPGHAGGLPAIMQLCPNATVIVSKKGAESIPGHYHQKWNFKPVSSGETLSLGERTLTFVEAPMLHWPDSMFTYVSPDGILMPNDAFGQHYATAFRFNDQVNQAELYEEALKYYPNILTPFSRLVIRKIDELLAMNLPVTKWKPGDSFCEGLVVKGVMTGGMSVVVLLGPPNVPAVMWAAKSIRDDFSGEGAAVAGFWHEAQSWIELGKHKNIVFVSRVFEVEGRPYIYLEYMPGGSLRGRLGKPLPLEQAASLVSHICSGMQYAWDSKNLVHRDLKPENVLLGSCGEVKITDWGLSKILDHADAAGAAAPHGNANRLATYCTKAWRWELRPTCPRSSSRTPRPAGEARTSTLWES